MNAGFAHTHESTFGPPSELIDISAFLKSELSVNASTPVATEILEECSVADIKADLQNTWDNVKLSAYLMKDYELHINNVHTFAVSDAKRKRKRMINFEEPSSQSSDSLGLQNSLKLVEKNLKSWPYSAESALFMRAPKNTDSNVLEQVKTATPSNNNDSSSMPEAIITLTIHNPLSWGHKYAARVSTHLLRSSQTLEDLFSLLICESSELPEEVTEDGEIRGYSEQHSATNRSCVICIEGLAYGDGRSTPDYADKLLEHLKLIPEDKRPKLTKAATSMASTQLGSLKIRINEPYYLLHQGNCEHFVVVDQIRSQRQPEDLSGYPLTTHIMPVLLDLCRACGKVPAFWAIVGDVRLPESPCLLCQPCWKKMGRSENEEVFVVPLPRYVVGWH